MCNDPEDAKHAAALALVAALCPALPPAQQAALAAFARWATESQAEILTDPRAHGHGTLTVRTVKGRIVYRDLLKTYPPDAA